LASILELCRQLEAPGPPVADGGDIDFASLEEAPFREWADRDRIQFDYTADVEKRNGSLLLDPQNVLV
jgi:hypothetical protein